MFEIYLFPLGYQIVCVKITGTEVLSVFWRVPAVSSQWGLGHF